MESITTKTKTIRKRDACLLGGRHGGAVAWVARQIGTDPQRRGRHRRREHRRGKHIDGASTYAANTAAASTVTGQPPPSQPAPPPPAPQGRLSRGPCDS